MARRSAEFHSYRAAQNRHQQWGAMREFQRRIRIALEEHQMLPGDPLRVYNTDGTPAASPTAHEEAVPNPSDPTAAKPNELNPFTAEGM
jgi:moderate conductance mechanosensitive channel